MSEKFKSFGEFANAVVNEANGGPVDPRLELKPIPLSSVSTEISTQGPDHIVMTDECFYLLLDHMPGYRSAGNPTANWELYGIPMEHYHTEELCRMRACELRQDHGIRVMLVA